MAINGNCLAAQSFSYPVCGDLGFQGILQFLFVVVTKKKLQRSVKHIREKVPYSLFFPPKLNCTSKNCVLWVGFVPDFESESLSHV